MFIPSDGKVNMKHIESKQVVACGVVKCRLLRREGYLLRPKR